MEKALEPPLIADVMVGRLARWLRILGFDVLYSNRFTDAEIVQIAAAEQRTVLTRDRGLAARLPEQSVIFIRYDAVDSQVGQVLQRLPGREFRIYSRCSQCNHPLRTVDRESIFERVPPYVYLTQTAFAECPGCRRIYWRGTHAGGIEEKVRRWKQI
jgi:uncharacterized protein with PIN domain